MASTTILTAADVTSIVRHVGLDAFLDELIDRLMVALAEHDRDVICTIDRQGFDYAKPDVGLLEWMPAMDLGRRVSIKAVGYHPTNPVERQTPTIQSVTSLFDTTDGRLIAVCESSLLTAMRTGAASAIATDILTAPGTVTLGVVGCGAQAATQVHAISRMRHLERVLAFDADPDVAATLAERVPVPEVRVETLHADGVDELADRSDVICTVTSVAVDAGPVLPDVGLRSHVHVNAVGSDFPGKVELPLSLLERATVCPDVVDQCLREGESQQLQRHMLGPDLVELVRSRSTWTKLRRSTTVFDSTGWAFEDLVAIELALDHARRLGIGTSVELHQSAVDPYDVYEAVRR